MAYYTIIEQSIIEKGFKDGKSDDEIRLLLVRNGYQCRTQLAIKQKRESLGLLRLSENPKAKETGDIAFKRAMLNAQKSGTETIIVGVVKDKRPLRYKVFHPEPVNSGCSSAAGLCAEG